MDLVSMIGLLLLEEISTIAPSHLVVTDRTSNAMHRRRRRRLMSVEGTGPQMETGDSDLFSLSFT